jgi:RsiW-degrading membrane proteinase PrsW (M82 family)
MSKGYNGNTEFYQKAKKSTLTLKDIFEDALKKHDKQDGEKLFMAGTSTSTPEPGEMLQEWKKPWLFLRVLAAGLIFLFLLYFMITQGYGNVAISPFAFFGAAVVPVAVLLFYWEMNIPRNIPIYEVGIMLLSGGCISLILTGVFNSFTGSYEAYYAPFVEEPTKLLALCIFIRKTKRNYILNGILIGGAIGAGFAMMETIGYFWYYNLDLNILVQRGITSPGAHVIWAAIYGGALAMVKGNYKLQLEHFANKEFLKYFFAAILLHFIWNYPIEIMRVPFFIDLKIVLLIVAAWLVLLSLIKKGIQQVLDLTSTAQVSDASSATKALLFGVSGIYAGQNIPLSGGKIIFGRDINSCNIIFPQDTAGISRIHCTVTTDGKYIWICDEDSSNGTYLSTGEKLQAGIRTRLYKGQKFYLANTGTMFEVR